MSVYSGPLPELLTIAEAAEALSVSVMTVRRLLHQRQIAYRKVRGRVRFTRSDIACYLEKARVEPIVEKIWHYER